MVAEGHWDSQKARRRETRTTRARGEVQGDREVKGDRQERGKDTEEIKDTGAPRREAEVQKVTSRCWVTDKKEVQEGRGLWVLEHR